MTPAGLIQELARRGITLSCKNGQLAFTAPAGVMTDALRAQITPHRAALLSLLGLTSEPTPTPAELPQLVRRIRAPVSDFSSMPLVVAGTTAPPVRLLTTTERPMTVVVRVVTPPGSFATLSFNIGDLVQTTTGTTPLGDTLILPVGDWQPIRMRAWQSLYAKGSIPGVIVSLAFGED